jgi:hypothetical protein
VTDVDAGPEASGALRAALIASAFSIPMFVAASLLQLRPFVWDTLHPGGSLIFFQRWRSVLQLGAWTRITLVIPMLFLAVSLAVLTYRRDPVRGPAGSVLVAASGMLACVSGIAQSSIGVFAEDYVPADPGARAHALSADALFWIHDNLATMALIVLSIAAVTLARPLRHAGLRTWATWAGRLGLPASVTVAILFYFRSDRGGSPRYLIPWAATVSLLVIWQVGLAVWCASRLARVRSRP